ncbi:MAG: hypothetical protein P9M14_17915 [Candidatus Alcyoniella australis]|nr:hypothetical protein [Candidatus Alcyoniella australis]
MGSSTSHERLKACTFAAVMLVALVCFCPAANADLTQGIRLGAMTLAPSVQLAMRFSDNVYFVPQDFKPIDETVVPQSKESDMILNAVAGLKLATAVPSFDAELGYELYNDYYMGMDDPNEGHDKLNAVNHTISGGLGYQAPVGLFLRLTDSFLIQQAFTQSEQFVDYLQGEQNHNEGRLFLGYRQGPYSNLYLHGVYTNTWDTYRRRDIYDRMIHRGEMEFRFKFLPRTALLVNGGGGMSNNPNFPDFNATMYYGTGGIRGQITEYLLLTVLGGYAMYDFAANENYQNYLAKAELGAQWGMTTKAALGYDHRVAFATDTNFFVTDEIYLRFNRLWFSRLISTLWASYQINGFSEPVSRDETFIQGRADLTYKILFWLYAGAGYSFEEKVQADPADFTTIRHVGTLRAIVKF